MSKETKSTLIRIGLAVVLFLAAGLLIYYVNPKQNNESKVPEEKKVEKKSDFILNIPKIKEGSDSNDLKDMKQKTKEIHQQMNKIAKEDGFDGASLEDKEISKKLNQVDQKLESIKNKPDNTSEFSAHIEHMQDLVHSSLNGSARSMATLYGHVSGLDQKLNDTKAIVDEIEISDYLEEVKNDSSIDEIQEWVARIQKEVEDGKLTEANLKNFSKDAKEKRDQVDGYLNDTKEQANKYKEAVESKKLDDQLGELKNQLSDIQKKKTIDEKKLKSLKDTLKKIEGYT